MAPSVAAGGESSDDESGILGDERSIDKDVFQSRYFLDNNGVCMQRHPATALCQFQHV